MNPFAIVYTGIANQLVKTPRELLATAIATLDPFWNVSQVRLMDEDDPDCFLVAMCILRDSFPAIYSEAVLKINQDVPSIELDRFILQSIRDMGIVLEHLDEIAYGVPVRAMGFDPDAYRAEADSIRSILEELCEFLEEHIQPDLLVVDKMIKELAELSGQYPMLGCLSVLFSWVYSISGNSLVDNVDETLNDYEPLEWTPENVELVAEMNEEADQLMEQVHRGLVFLENNPRFLSLKAGNYLERGKNDEQPFDWGCTEFDFSIDRNPGTRAVVL